MLRSAALRFGGSIDATIKGNDWLHQFIVKEITRHLSDVVIVFEIVIFLWPHDQLVLQIKFLVQRVVGMNNQVHMRTHIEPAAHDAF